MVVTLFIFTQVIFITPTIVALLQLKGSFLGELLLILAFVCRQYFPTHYKSILQLNAEVLDHSYCQIELALMYETGHEDFPKDPRVAHYWMKRAATNSTACEEDLTEAQYHYARYWENGIGCESPNDKEACAWMLKAAQNYHPEAMRYLMRRQRSLMFRNV